MKTLRDVRACLCGLGGALVRSKSEQEAAPFLEKAHELRRQIVTDNNVTIETENLPPGTVLSPRAEQLLRELEQLKEHILLKSLR